jgi:hypothetical protein
MSLSRSSAAAVSNSAVAYSRHRPPRCPPPCMPPFTRAFSLLVAASVLTRLMLQPFTTALSLTSRYELSSPMTSSSRVAEGVHLMALQHSPYTTDLVHLPPWFLSLSRAMLQISLPSVPQIGLLILYALADAAVVVSMGFIHHSLHLAPLPTLTAVKLCFNPLALLSCLALTTSSLYHALVFGSVALASAAQLPMIPSLLLLAAAASMDFRALTLLPVVLAMRSRVAPAPSPAPSSSAQVLQAVFHVLSFVLCYAALLLVDVLLLADPSHSTHTSFFARFQSGSAAVWQAVPMFDLQVRELVPTIGTAWYMMMECFSDKRPVYLFILHFPPVALTLPIITRFWKQPHAALFSILALHSLWRPYPEVCRRSVSVNTVFRFISTSRTHPHSRFCAALSHAGHVCRASAPPPAHRLHPPFIHHLCHIRIRLCSQRRHVVGVGGHRRRQCQLRVWGQVRPFRALFFIVCVLKPFALFSCAISMANS